MKFNTVKRMGQRVLSMALVMAFFVQIAPFATLTASAEWSAGNAAEITETAASVQEPAADGVVTVTSADQLVSGVPAGSTYVLANNITMGADQQIGLVAGVLDGAGCTITLTGGALVNELTGTIQNLLVDGKISLGEGQAAIACTINGGTLQNCGATVEIDPGWSFSLGGLAGTITNAKIYNSYFAGTALDMDGLAVNSGIFCKSHEGSAPSTVKNCYYASGINVGGGSGWNREDTSNGKKTLANMKTSEFVQLLNASNVGSGYIWAAEEGQLPKLVVGGGALEQCDKTALEAAIQEAQRKNESDYSGETWAAMQQALRDAQEVYEKIDAVQDEVNAAEQALRDAIAALAEKVRDLSPVEPPKNGVIPISSQADLAQIDGSDPALFYQLTQDIVMEGNYISPSLAGVLDGNGHTIILRTPSPLLDTITETGVVQNLRVKVEGNFTNRQEFAPYAAKLRGGMIVNCISEVTGQHSTGYVLKMEGGDMVNCLTMGHNRRGAFVFFQKSTDHRNTNGYKGGKFHNCYWSASNSVENIMPAENLIGCEAVGDETLRAEAFMNQLNSQKGAFGTSWGRDENGYPYFGADQGGLVIDGSKNRYPVQFVWHDGKVSDVEGGILQLSPQVTNSNRIAGTFQLKDVPEGGTITWHCDDRANQEIMQMNESGQLNVYHDGGAVVRAVEHKADGTQQLAAELRVISASREIQELRLLMNGKEVSDTLTIQGSEVGVLAVEVKYAGSDTFEPLPVYLVELTAEKPDLMITDYNAGAFRFTQPGTSKLTVKEKNQKANPASVTITVTSEYVPVERIVPDISGTIKVHYRNSMGTGQFLTLPQTVRVEPANASNKSNITVASSDSGIAVYEGGGYTPYKDGTVTFTATIHDNGRVVEGSSEATFVCENPLTEVSAPEENIIVAQGTKQVLPLTFRGQPGNGHEVTEPDLVWTYDKQGVVSIQRPDPLMQVRETGGVDDGNWVASTKFEVKGLRPGTVVATGTPVDTTGGAKPVKITITVQGDDTPAPGFDIPKFIETGKQAASNYLKEHNGYSFGEEWSIYALLRAGQELPQEKLDSYYNDVVDHVSAWDATVLPTDVERAALTLNIMGKDITDVNGVNLVELICNHPTLTRQGSNALAWALIALDMNHTEIPADATWSRERMVRELLEYQNADGGFGLDKTNYSSIDMTAMSIQALAPYRKQDEVAAALDRAVGYLAAAADKNLNLGSAESISQVILALAVLERDIVAEPGFGDEMENILSALSEYMVEGKGFKHDKDGRVNKMATTQALQALCAYERFLNGESGYWDLKGTGQQETPAEKVSSMIAALPQEITLEDTHAVQQCRTAYEQLTAAQQAQVTNLPKLEAAEAALKKLANVDSVINMIAALPENITLADQDAVKAARSAYDLLTAAQQAQVTNVDKLLKAEKAIADQKAAAQVEKVIQVLPNSVSMADKQAVQAARSAYEALTDHQKALVKNLDKLIRAEEALKDWDAAYKVMAMIKDLPTELKASDAKAVQAARSAYEALTEKQQTLVLNLYMLERAEQIVSEKTAVQTVEDAIDALPNSIAVADAQVIKAARAAYNQLAPELRERVRNLEKLIAAEKELKALRKPMEKPTGKAKMESNVVIATVNSGVVSAKQLAEVQGKELILRIEGTMETGETYTMSVYGKDVAKAVDFSVGMKRQGSYEAEIHKLSEEPEIFYFLQTGAFPAPVMVQMETALADGAYLLLRYDSVQQRAGLVSRVQVKNGSAQFIVQEGGAYFLAKKASKKSVAELEEAEKLSAEPQPETPDEEAETVPVVEETKPVQQEQKNGFILWMPMLLILVAGGVVIALKKRKENKGE